MSPTPHATQIHPGLNDKQRTLYTIAWVQSLLGMGGSLFFSEVLRFPPCVLCWYQRIALYPLVFLLPVALVREDKKFSMYGLMLTLPGLCISLYHNLLYYKVLPESIAPCLAGVSCTTKFVQYFGFITIPLLALCAFLVMTVCFALALKAEPKSA